MLGSNVILSLADRSAAAAYCDRAPRPRARPTWTCSLGIKRDERQKSGSQRVGTQQDGKPADFTDKSHGVCSRDKIHQPRSKSSRASCDRTPYRQQRTKHSFSKKYLSPQVVALIVLRDWTRHRAPTETLPSSCRRSPWRDAASPADPFQASARLSSRKSIANFSATTVRVGRDERAISGISAANAQPCSGFAMCHLPR
jgi:hypothetical protein